MPPRNRPTILVIVIALLALVATACEIQKDGGNNSGGKAEPQHYTVEEIEVDALYLVSTNFYNHEKADIENRTIQYLAKGLKKLAENYHIKNAIPLTSEQWSTNPTRALLVFVEREKK